MLTLNEDKWRLEADIQVLLDCANEYNFPIEMSESCTTCGTRFINITISLPEAMIKLLNNNISYTKPKTDANLVYWEFRIYEKE